MARTKRSQNRCKSCGYTWYPRGKSISLKCPSCGSEDVGFAGGTLGVIALVVAAVFFFGGNKDGAAPPAQDNALTSSAASSTVPTGSADEGTARQAQVATMATSSQVDGETREETVTPEATDTLSASSTTADFSKSLEQCGDTVSDDDCRSADKVQNDLF